MISYKIFLNDNDSIIVHFNQNQTLELSVDRELIFFFSEVDGELKISTEAASSLDMQDEEVQRYFCKIEPVASDIKSIPFLAGLGESCCTIGGREYCVTNGCADTPCGRLCG